MTLKKKTPKLLKQLLTFIRGIIMKNVQCMQSTQIFLRRTSIITRKRQAYTITYEYVIQRIKEKI